MEQKLDLIINMIKDQSEKINELNSKYDSLKGNVSRIEQKVDNLSIEVECLKDYTYGVLTTKLDNLSNQVTILEDYAHDRCEAALDGWSAHLEKQEEIGSNVTNLNSKTENHEIRITVLEDVLKA